MTKILTTGLAALMLGFAAPAAWSGTAAGAYLAASQARADSNFAVAAEYYTLALAADPGNADLMQDLVQAEVGLGRFDIALPVAIRLAAEGADSQVGAMVRIEEAARAGDWQKILDEQAGGGLRIAPLVDGLVAAWSELGAGRGAEALAGFDAVADKPSTRAFGLYHKALALALAGDYEAADAILSGRNGDKLNLTRRGVLAHVEILSQLGRDAEALDLLAEVFGTDPDPVLVALRQRLERGEALAMSIITRPADGLAEVFFTVATALQGDATDAFVLNFTRTAEALQPTHVDALLLSADLLVKLGRYSLAIASYDRIPADSPYSYVAELGRADALIRSGQVADGIGALQSLGARTPDVPGIFVTLGDALRKEERFAEAKLAYDRAIALFDKPDASQWFVYFARGISEEREHDWEAAEADLRQALKLRPDQPQVLNYLGYSYVDKGQDLEEALDMIRRAVKARPDDGFIIDSLGWAFYRLGRYPEAVVQMERAVEQVPVDPVINDHLGDVYWAVGRKREAEFQWNRALSFEPEPADAVRIRRKLEIGLDAVLKEEGAKPLKLAKDG